MVGLFHEGLDGGDFGEREVHEVVTGHETLDHVNQTELAADEHFLDDRLETEQLESQVLHQATLDLDLDVQLVQVTLCLGERVAQLGDDVDDLEGVEELYALGGYLEVDHIVVQQVDQLLLVGPVALLVGILLAQQGRHHFVDALGDEHFLLVASSAHQ